MHVYPTLGSGGENLTIRAASRGWVVWGFGRLSARGWREGRTGPDGGSGRLQLPLTGWAKASGPQPNTHHLYTRQS